MSARITRRAVVAGGVAGVAVAAAGGGYAALRLLPPRTADSEAAEYAKLLAEVHADYVNGRVVEHEGWILSQHEFDTIGVRQAERKTKAG
jgi:hypothetical protein